MTCILATRNKSTGKLIFASERRICMDTQIVRCPNPKITKHKNGLMIGGCGDSPSCEMLTGVFKPPRHLKKYSDKHYILNVLRVEINQFFNSLDIITDDFDTVGLLIGYKSKLYFGQIGLANDLSIEEIEPPFAMGAGEKYCIGAYLAASHLLSKDTKTCPIQVAMKVTSWVCWSCDAEVDIIEE